MADILPFPDKPLLRTWEYLDPTGAFVTIEVPVGEVLTVEYASGILARARHIALTN